jgi:hypothetical protein
LFFSTYNQSSLTQMNIEMLNESIHVICHAKGTTTP